MIYSTPEFILLLLITLAAYSVAASHRLRFLVLLAASFIFYAWTGPCFLLIFCGVILFSWLSVALSERYPAAKRWLIPCGICGIIAHLFFWKYFPWVASQIQLLWPGFLRGRVLYLPLPVGISFFTLQSVAYLVDYYDGRAPMVSLPFYALFKGFFAQLIAGPIVRAQQIFPQLEKLEKPKPADVSLGLTLFITGFFKKVAVADRMAFFVDLVFSAPQNFGRFALIKALLGYAVQVWADFSGYTDMGRGAALMLGIRLPENFLSPYFSRTPSELWNRWHITLGQWIRDYLFNPLALAGRRTSAQGVFWALVVTMSIAGLWHGANWNYILFGLYQGLLLVLERKIPIRWPAGEGASRVFWQALRIVFMFCLVLLGWMIFRAENMGILTAYVKGLALGCAAPAAAPRGLSIYLGVVFCFLTQAVCYYDLQRQRWTFLSAAQEALANRFPNLSAEGSGRAQLAGACAGVLMGLVFFATILLRATRSRAFIYFQF